MRKLKFPKIRDRKIQINITKLFGVLCTGSYVITCGLFLIPQIDYHNWYPVQLGKHDLNLGIDFSEHKKAVLDFSEASLSNAQLATIVQTIYKRAATSNLNDVDIEINGPKLELHIPNTYDDSFIKTLLSQGKIEIKTPVDGIDFQEDIAKMFDLNSYVSTDIKQEKIERARLISQNDQYNYIEISTNNEQIDAWKKAAESTGDYNAATVINGDLNISWIMSPDGVQQEYPVLLLPSGRTDIDIIVEQLMNKPLSVEMPAPIISTVDTIYPINLLYAFIAVLTISIGLALGWRKYVKNQSWTDILILSLIIIGQVTMIKLSLIPINITILILLTLIFTAIAGLEFKKQSLISAILIITGVSLTLFNNPSLTNIATTLTQTGVYLFICFIISVFFNLHSNEK